MSEVPIIVGGSHRSGTTLVRRILDAHPAISCPPEIKFMLDFDGGFRDDPHAHARFLGTARQAAGDERVMRHLGRAFVELHRELAAEAGKKRWADKNPENVLYAEAWGRLLGDRWTMVHVVRDPRDVVASMNEAGFPWGAPGDSVWDRVRHWRRYVKAGREFGAAHPGRYAEVSYESLVGDPAAAISTLMSALGESFDERQLLKGGVPLGPGLGDPKAADRPEIEASGVGRWRDDLTPEELEAIAAVLAEDPFQDQPGRESVPRQMSGADTLPRETTETGVVALTFDDGPDPRWTPAVLDALLRSGARATFFFQAPLVTRHPDLVGRVADLGHEVGFHCTRHVRHSNLTPREIRDDLERGLEQFARAGIRPSKWRTPWGNVTDATRELAEDSGLELWNWSVDTHDWRGDTAEEMLAATLPQVSPGSVVLMHDGIGPGATRHDCMQTVLYTEALIGRIAERGMRPGLLATEGMVETA